MASHHDHHGPQEKKPVAFSVPLILAAITLVVILLLVNMCDAKHGHCECKENCSKECMEACEKGDHSKHPGLHGVDHEVKSSQEERAPEGHIAPTVENAKDSAKAE